MHPGFPQGPEEICFSKEAETRSLKIPPDTCVSPEKQESDRWGAGRQEQAMPAQCPLERALEELPSASARRAEHSRAPRHLPPHSHRQDALELQAPTLLPCGCQGWAPSALRAQPGEGTVALLLFPLSPPSAVICCALCTLNPLRPESFLEQDRLRMKTLNRNPVSAPLPSALHQTMWPHGSLKHLPPEHLPHTQDLRAARATLAVIYGVCIPTA